MEGRIWGGATARVEINKSIGLVVLNPINPASALLIFSKIFLTLWAVRTISFLPFSVLSSIIDLMRPYLKWTQWQYMMLRQSGSLSALFPEVLSKFTSWQKRHFLTKHRFPNCNQELLTVKIERYYDGSYALKKPKPWLQFFSVKRCVLFGGSREVDL